MQKKKNILLKTEVLKILLSFIKKKETLTQTYHKMTMAQENKILKIHIM